MFNDDLGPDFNDMNDLPNVTAPENVLGTAIDQATRAVDDYIRHPKGYITRPRMFGRLQCHL